MAETLICLECGADIDVGGRTAGQEFPCPSCRNLVVVPVLTRAHTPLTRNRGKRLATPRDRPLPKTSPLVWAACGAALLGALLLVVLVRWTMQRRDLHVYSRAAVELAAKAAEASKKGDHEAAMRGIDAAIAKVSGVEPRDETLIAALRAQRDQLTVDEMKARAATIAALPPEEQVAAYRGFLDRVGDNPRLVRVKESLHDRLNHAYDLWAEADLKSAAERHRAGDAAGAIDLCERAIDNTNTLTNERRKALRAQADALAVEIIPRRGLELGEIRGTFTLGTASSYEPILRGELATILRRRGYVIRPDSSFWDSLWAQPIPFRMTVEVDERYAGLYPQTKCRISTTAARLALQRRQQGPAATIWEGAAVTRTRSPLPKLKPFRKDFRNPDVEKVFYDDARQLFGPAMLARLETIPEYSSLPGAAPAPKASGGRAASRRGEASSGSLIAAGSPATSPRTR